MFVNVLTTHCKDSPHKKFWDEYHNKLSALYYYNSRVYLRSSDNIKDLEEYYPIENKNLSGDYFSRTIFHRAPKFSFPDIKNYEHELKTFDKIIKNANIGYDEKIKEWKNIAFNPNICHTVMTRYADFTKELLFLNNVYNTNIAICLWHVNYLLANTELMHLSSITLDSPYVYTHEQALKLMFFANIRYELNPMYVNINLRNGPDTYHPPLVLVGTNRTICDQRKLKIRIRKLTDKAFDGFEKYNNVYLVGSALLECVTNTHLDKYTFKKRSKIFYPSSEAFPGDIDIAVQEQSYKKFIDIAYELVNHISKNLGCESKCEIYSATNSIRFHVFNKQLTKKIEIFKTPSSPIALVSRFHIAAVRMYWDFKNLYMTRSCLACLYTGISENIMWSPTMKQKSYNVILKYIQRGFTVVLNYHDIRLLKNYAMRNKEWKTLFRYMGFRDDADIYKFDYDGEDDFFKPHKYKAGICYNLNIKYYRTALLIQNNEKYKKSNNTLFSLLTPR